MPLTAQRLLQLIPRLAALPASQCERRSHHRATLWEKVNVLSAQQPIRPIDAYLRDVSSEGMGIVCSRPMQLGDQLRLVLDGHHPQAPTFACRVVACRRLGQNLFGVGCRFTPETLRLLASSPRSTAA
jgi:hypothetical protein